MNIVNILLQQKTLMPHPSIGVNKNLLAWQLESLLEPQGEKTHQLPSSEMAGYL